MEFPHLCTSLSDLRGVSWEFIRIYLQVLSKRRLFYKWSCGTAGFTCSVSSPKSGSPIFAVASGLVVSERDVPGGAQPAGLAGEGCAGGCRRACGCSLAGRPCRAVPLSPGVFLYAGMKRVAWGLWEARSRCSTLLEMLTKKCHRIAGVRSSTGFLIDVISAPYWKNPWEAGHFLSLDFSRSFS